MYSEGLPASLVLLVNLLKNDWRIDPRNMEKICGVGQGQFVIILSCVVGEVPVVFFRISISRVLPLFLFPFVLLFGAIPKLSRLRGNPLQLQTRCIPSSLRLSPVNLCKLRLELSFCKLV